MVQAPQYSSPAVKLKGEDMEIQKKKKKMSGTKMCLIELVKKMIQWLEMWFS